MPDSFVGQGAFDVLVDWLEEKCSRLCKKMHKWEVMIAFFEA